MSKINRIRIMNLNYNNNTIRVDDEIFDLNGESTLLSLRNGGGKTVLVQMVMSLFVNKKYRDFEDRLFKSYFTTARPTFIMTEWCLDGGQGYFLVGMMVHKSQNVEENNNEDLEIITFTGAYTSACAYDLDNIPVIEQTGESKILKGFGACKAVFEELKKSKDSKFSYYDMSHAYQRKMYFSKLLEYQINNKEWETIIRKVNRKESGLSELFANAKDEKGLVEKWFLDAIENKLNQEKSRIKEFQSLTYKLVKQYRANETLIKRRTVIKKYFEDAEMIKEQIDKYEESEEKLAIQKSTISVLLQDVNDMVSVLQERLEEENRGIHLLEKQLTDIEHEKISFEIYEMEDKRKEYVQDRILSEENIIKSRYIKNEAEKELCRFQCAQLYEEVQDFKNSVSELQKQIKLLMTEKEDNQEEIRHLGGILYHYYNDVIEHSIDVMRGKEKQMEEKRGAREAAEAEHDKKSREVNQLSTRIGELKTAIEYYDETEKQFNHKFDSDFSRNIVGEYEEGMLELWERIFEDELDEIHARMNRLWEEMFSLKKRKGQLERESENVKVFMAQCKYQEEIYQNQHRSLLEEKNQRIIIMKYIDAPESELDQKVLLLGRLDRKIEGLETAKEDYIGKLKTFTKEYDNLRQGKVLELPENVLAYFEEQSIEFIYGMEWLKRNGRTVKQNQKLIEQNPFLPYAIIIERQETQKLQSKEKEIYTNFPIPIIIRENLEETLADTKGGFTSFDKISFFCLFNRHLLNPAELEMLLSEKKKEIDGLKEKIQTKKIEISQYTSHKNGILAQTFTTALMEEKEQQIKEKQEEQKQLGERYSECNRQKRENEKRQEELGHEIEKAKAAEGMMERRKEEYKSLKAAYEKYISDRQTRLRLEKKIKETENQIEDLKEIIKKLGSEMIKLQDEKKNLNRLLEQYRKESTRYSIYEKEEKCSVSEDFDYGAAQAEYAAMTKGISASIDNLEDNLKKENYRYEKKKNELNRKNKFHFKQEDYMHIRYSQEEAEQLEENITSAAMKENAAIEENNSLGQNIARLEERIEERKRYLFEKTGYDKLKEKSHITDIDFPARRKLTEYEKNKKLQNKNKLSERLMAFQNTQAVLAEYKDFMPIRQVEGCNLENMTEKELENYQGTLRRDLHLLREDREKQRQYTENIVRKIGEQEDYQDEFFQKGFRNISSLTENVYDMKRQLYILLGSYNNILEKLQVDLDNIDKERRNVEELFLEYVKDMDDNMRRIDKNSTIYIRGRNIKMLKIGVPDWEENKELYQAKVRDYVHGLIHRGLETIEKNGNVEELLGKIITTKRLYDETVGMGNIDIRLYKIEAEREVPISWAEVSANSGGEGFLSAFIVLSCLLSYMRRDETDLFAVGEEGKVLIMDNPFAQTNAQHLLKPLMDMAKKTNTQLICLSGLGGDSIYNRFDNIYVLNVISSNMKQGMQYIQSMHKKGEEFKLMRTTQFQVEQMEFAVHNTNI